MLAFLITLGVVGYLAADLYAARWLYATWRARSIDRRVKQNERTYGGLVEPKPQGERTSKAVEDFNELYRTEYMLGAFAVAAIWPVALLAWGLFRFFDAAPARSRSELEAERDALSRRIAELEADLGIKTPKEA